MASFAAPLLGGLLGGLGGLLGGGGQKQATQTTTNSDQSQTGNFSTAPNFSALQQALMNQFTQGASSLYNQSLNMQPYESSGLQNINQGTNANSQAINMNLAQRGLQFSPTANAAQTQNITAGQGQQAQFMNSIPLLQRQMQQSALQQLMGAFGVIPTGQTGNTSSTSNGTSTTTGNGALSSTGSAGNALVGAGAGLFAGGFPQLMQSMSMPSLPGYGSGVNPSSNFNWGSIAPPQSSY